MNISAELQDVLLAGEPKAPQMKKVEVEDILNLARGAVLRRASEKQIDLIVHSPLSKCELMVDMELMRRVLWNLFYYSDYAIGERRRSNPAERGRIELSCEIAGDRAKFLWQDNGCGIADEVMPKIFKLFFTTRRPGSGLGLSIVKQVIEDHGGSIFVDSELGKWTKFRIELPRP